MPEGEEQQPTYRPGEIVNGHVLSADGSRWLPLADDAPPASPSTKTRPAGSRATVVILAVLCAIFGIVAVAVILNEQGANTGSGQSGATAPASDAVEVWVRQGLDAIEARQAAEEPIRATFASDTAMPHDLNRVYSEQSAELDRTTTRLSSIAASAPAAAPPELVEPMQDIASVYRSQSSAIDGLVSSVERGDGAEVTRMLDWLNELDAQRVRAGQRFRAAIEEGNS
jgi:hypothetical protein